MCFCTLKLIGLDCTCHIPTCTVQTRYIYVHTWVSENALCVEQYMPKDTLKNSPDSQTLRLMSEGLTQEGCWKDTYIHILCHSCLS